MAAIPNDNGTAGMRRVLNKLRSHIGPLTLKPNLSAEPDLRQYLESVLALIQGVGADQADKDIILNNTEHVLTNALRTAAADDATGQLLQLALEMEPATFTNLPYQVVRLAFPTERAAREAANTAVLDLAIRRGATLLQHLREFLRRVGTALHMHDGRIGHIKLDTAWYQSLPSEVAASLWPTVAQQFCRAGRDVWYHTAENIEHSSAWLMLVGSASGWPRMLTMLRLSDDDYAAMEADEEQHAPNNAANVTSPGGKALYRLMRTCQSIQSTLNLKQGARRGGAILAVGQHEQAARQAQVAERPAPVAGSPMRSGGPERSGRAKPRVDRKPQQMRQAAQKPPEVRRVRVGRYNPNGCHNCNSTDHRVADCEAHIADDGSKIAFYCQLCRAMGHSLLNCRRNRAAAAATTIIMYETTDPDGTKHCWFCGASGTHSTEHCPVHPANASPSNRRTGSA